MRWFLIVFILLLSISCTKTLLGVYGDKYPHDNYQCNQVQFRKDSTYEMYFNVHMFHRHAIGKWSIKGDTITLNSKPHYSIKYVEDLNKDNIIVKVTEGGEPTFAYVFVGRKEYFTDYKGTVKLDKAGIDSILIGFVPLPVVTIYMDNDKLKRVGVIEVDFDKDRDYDIFHVNEQWVFKNGRIYYPIHKDEESNDSTPFAKKSFYRRVNLKQLTCKQL